MKISLKEWSVFILAAVLCFVLWFRLGYPQFSFLNLTVTKSEALEKAENYLHSRGIEAREYSKAVVISSDPWADRYLQKTLGFKQEEVFFKKHHYELFYWAIRFFKPFEKEEFLLCISAGTGEVLSFKHSIEDIAKRPTVGEDAARSQAEVFLKDFYGVNPLDYVFHEQKIKSFDFRTDYSFSWEKKDAYVPWKEQEGNAKLLMGATVSGDEIREFYKNNLDIPEKFRRHVERQMVSGESLFIFYFLTYIFLLGCSVVILLKRRNHIVTHLCKKWFLGLAIFLVCVNGLSLLNNIQTIVMNYPTSASFASFMGAQFLREAINMIFLSFAFVIPGLAGESLRLEVFPHKPYSGFTQYLKTTFLSRGSSRYVLLGYVLFIITLGLQSGLFAIGQKAAGVWKESIRLTQFSSAWVPFFSAFAVGITASLTEEVTFRLFGISLAKKYLKNTALAVLFISLLWGIGHSAYAIFPVWFRCIEVGIIGILYGMIFIRYGLIPLIVSHYLFDVFFGVAGYLLGHATVFLFSGSILVLSLPLLFALISYFVNKNEQQVNDKQALVSLSSIQKYNLDILMTYISAKKSQGSNKAALREELLAHDWDIELVVLALEKVYGGAA